MPLLRWHNADHRDLPARSETNVPRTTTGAGRMTKRLSFVTENHQLHSADLVQTASACSFPASHQAAMKAKQTALSASSPACASTSGTICTFSHTPDATVAPTDYTPSPQTVPRPPRLPTWEVFQRGSSSPQCATFRSHPHQKNLHQCRLSLHAALRFDVRDIADIEPLSGSNLAI